MNPISGILIGLFFINFFTILINQAFTIFIHPFFTIQKRLPIIRAVLNVWLVVQPLWWYLPIQTKRISQIISTSFLRE